MLVSKHHMTYIFGEKRFFQISISSLLTYIRNNKGQLYQTTYGLLVNFYEQHVIDPTSWNPFQHSILCGLVLPSSADPFIVAVVAPAVVAPAADSTLAPALSSWLRQASAIMDTACVNTISSSTSSSSSPSISSGGSQLTTVTCVHFP